MNKLAQTVEAWEEMTEDMGEEPSLSEEHQSNLFIMTKLYQHSPYFRECLNCLAVAVRKAGHNKDERMLILKVMMLLKESIGLDDKGFFELITRGITRETEAP